VIVMAGWIDGSAIHVFSVPLTVRAPGFRGWVLTSLRVGRQKTAGCLPGWLRSPYGPGAGFWGLGSGAAAGRAIKNSRSLAGVATGLGIGC